MSKKYKILRPKPCIVDEATRKLELQPVDKIIDADTDLMKANMERFESMGWAMEIKMDSVDETLEVEAEVKPKRARNKKGQLKADDPSTPDIDEAWEGGKAPKKTAKKTTAKKTTKKKTTTKKKS
jgi:hypothetical protein